MAYYLRKERSIEEVCKSWRRYQEYLRQHQQQFPPGAFAIATSDWWYDFNDHRSPHDAWLESVTFSEPSSGERSEIRHTQLRVRLLAAYHDGFIELCYPRVFRYTLQSADCARGLGDWCYDEFTLSPDAHVIHEIEWTFKHRWIIEASDLEYQWIPK